jgi:hypothetical protein
MPRTRNVAALLIVLLCACGNPAERRVADLIEGGERAEVAKVALMLAKGTAVEPLIRAFEDDSHSVSVRLDVAEH